MAISVIIPVYNAATHVEQAVLFTLAIEEVKEIILVEDASTDQSYEICQKLAIEHADKVQLHIHPQHEHKGAGASRNLGIQQAQQEFVAFLDANNYYLSGRFEEPLRILREYEHIDFVVSPSLAEGTQVYQHVSPAINNMNFDLFAGALTGKHGYFDINSIIIRRKSLEQLDAYFNPDLQYHEDAEFCMRVCYYLKGYAEKKTWPGAIVRKDSNEKSEQENAENSHLFWVAAYDYFQDKSIPKHLMKFIKSRIAYYKALKNDSILAKWELFKIKMRDPKILKKIK